MGKEIKTTLLDILEVPGVYFDSQGTRYNYSGMLSCFGGLLDEPAYIEGDRIFMKGIESNTFLPTFTLGSF